MKPRSAVSVAGIALAAGVALAGCQTFPEAVEVTSAPAITYRNAPEAASSADPTTAGSVTTKTGWEGARGLTSVTADLGTDRAVISGRDGESGSRLVVVNTATRKVMWDSNIERPDLPAGAKLAAEEDGTLQIIETADGAVLLAAFGAGCTVGTNPCRGDSSVGLAALDLDTGAVRWTRTLRTLAVNGEGFVNASGVQVAGVVREKVVVSIVPSNWAPLRAESAEVAVLDLETGKVLWRKKGYAADAVAGGNIFATIAQERPDPDTFEEGAAGIAVLSVHDGKIEWKRTDDQVLARRPVAATTAHLVVAQPDGELALLLNSHTGSTVRDLAGGNVQCRPYRASAVCLDPLQNRLKVIDLTTAEQRVIPVPEDTQDLYAVAGDLAFVSDRRVSVIVDLESGAPLNGNVTAPTVLAGDEAHLLLAAEPDHLDYPADSGPVRLVSVTR